MNQPALARPLWFVLAAGAFVAASLVTVILLGFGFFARGERQALSALMPATAGATPTGRTPALDPGEPGWLPSGSGVRLPIPQVVNGRPEGLWWRLQQQPDGSSVVVTHVFLPDGTCASSPRLGAGDRFDLGGQRTRPAPSGVGTFLVAGEQISEVHDGVTTTASFRHGTSAEGAWFSIGGERYSPLTPPDAPSLPATWTRADGHFVLRADGTYETSHLVERKWVKAGEGTWQLEGYLLSMQPAGEPASITLAGASGSTFLVIGSSLYSR